MPLNPNFDAHPEEARLIGKILTGYGELEFWLTCCVSEVIGNENTAFRLIFRMRNESQRIDAADAILYPAMQALKLGGPYGHVVGAMRHCKTIRNQYAHCHWDDDETTGRLRLFNMEDAAFSAEGDAVIKFSETTADLLREQVSYFDYCFDGLRYLYCEQQIASGRGEEQTSTKPKARPKPRLHIPLG